MVGAEPARGRSLRGRGVGRKVALIAPREVSRSRVERCLSHQCRTRARLSSRGAMKATFDWFPPLEMRLREQARPQERELRPRWRSFPSPESTQIRSSRALEEALRVRLDFRWLAEGRVIDHTTLRRTARVRVPRDFGWSVGVSFHGPLA